MDKDKIQERIAELQQQANQVATQVLTQNAQYQFLAGRITERGMDLEVEESEDDNGVTEKVLKKEAKP